jgi:two-component system LytT family response regulator
MATQARIRSLIVDDEPHARIRLQQLLKPEADFEVVGECANGEQAVETILQMKPDLIFLDMQMPKLTGLEVCERLLESKITLPLVIFVTAYDEYALKAFEVHAVDYLLKPFDRDRFLKALAHARATLRRAQPSALAKVVAELRPEPHKLDRLVFKQSGRIILVRTETIDWLEADGNYVRVHAQGEAHYVRDTLAALEAQLPPEQFRRISRSAVVNLEKVKELHPLFYGDYAVLLHNGAKLTLSRHYRDRLDFLLGGSGS